MFIARRRVIGGLVGMAAGATLSVSSLWTRPALAVPQSLHFKAYRDKSPVGTHTVDVQPSGNQMNVTIKIDLNVSMAFVTLFEFKHDCEEIWQSGRLVSLRSKTNDNGDRFQVTGKATPEGFRIEGPGGPAIAPADAGNVWYDEAGRWVKALFEKDGEQMEYRLVA